MKKGVLATVLLIFFLACETKENMQASQSIISEADYQILTYLKEVNWPKAYREQDTILLNAILGDDFQMVDAQGNWSNKTMELEWIKKHASSYDSFFYEIKRLDVLPNSTAMICGAGHIYNDTVHTIYQSSNVLIKRQGIWKAIASHVSGVKAVE
ncbi:DUF4440 domain-containing protein [Muricauda sp. JGD-17]|uniref:DUF4440 domain-containing protein n=1 Tax=Flagellimonas ochracea TaxID=2696472 RepID=A0A964TCI8_9FLAO|nr:DUF4440 domain-containing protein [Allomuricauda ochracea]NAY91518.1 DUF4440 domain-containing protein [Allomuricauda ochracea]